MLFVFRYHLVVSLVAGLLVLLLTHRAVLRGGRTHGIRKLLAVTLLELRSGNRDAPRPRARETARAPRQA
jgi:hypothetical protein